MPNSPAEVAQSLIATFPDWDIAGRDTKPRRLVDGYQGYQIVLRRTWKHYESLPQAAFATGPPGPFTWQHEDWTLVLVPLHGSPPPIALKSRLEWPPDDSPYYTLDACLGDGCGFRWFSHGRIPLLHLVHRKFDLQGGDDPIQRLADGLLIDDTGSDTANSSSALIAQYGDRALPYIEQAIAQAEATGVDPWRSITALGGIHSSAATNMLIRLFDSGDDQLSRAAAYALIHTPYRKSAKRVYLAMLRQRMSVQRVAAACVAVRLGRSDSHPAESDGPAGQSARARVLPSCPQGAGGSSSGRGAAKGRRNSRRARMA